MSEENQFYIPTEQKLIEGMEVIDIEPTQEEVVEKIQVDTIQVRKELSFLANRKLMLSNEVMQLETKKTELDKELLSAREKVDGEVKKMGEVITKKVAALEVIKQIKMTQLFLVLLFVPFLIIQGGIKKFTPFVMGVDAMFIGAWVFHLIMNQRKMRTLKQRYSL